MFPDSNAALQPPPRPTWRLAKTWATFATHLFLALFPGTFLHAQSTSIWQSSALGRHRRLEVPMEGRNGFTAMPPEITSIRFTNSIPEQRSLTNHILLNGSGVALGDIDGDGRCDVFLAGMGGGSALYRNLGDWHFTNITASAFPIAPGDPSPLSGLDATGAVFADLDGDGRLDLLVNTIGLGTRCFHNLGNGRFQEVTDKVGLGGISGSMSMALADVDGDRDLDLYVVNYRSSTGRDDFQQRFEVKNVDGRPEVIAVNGRSTTEPDLVGRFTIDETGHLTEHGEASVLYLNDGHGNFTPVSATGGRFRDEHGVPLVAPLYDWGLSARFRDLNGDGAPDLYVCNDLNTPDRIWLNDGQGRFRAIPRTAIRKTSWFSMGVDFGDLNRDGFDDFFVTDMLSRDPVRRQIEADHGTAELEPFTGSDTRPQTARNTLFVGRGDTTYAEVAWMAGLAASDWSWSPVFLDVDLDGYEDILITTGFERDVQDADMAEEIEAIRKRQKLNDADSRTLRRRFPHLALPNLAYRNQGNLTFVEAGRDWGFDQVGVSQGVALADLDGDGDLDVVINRQNEAPLFLRNNTPAPRIAVRLHGRAGNSQGIGARLEVRGGPVTQTQEVGSGGRYLSGDDPLCVFAAGTPTNRLEVHVLWRNGRTTDWTGAVANQVLEIDEPEGEPVPRTIPPAPPALFADVSERLGHRHFDTPFNDFERQPLLPRQLSQLGPAVAWGDLNGDGKDDLVVGSGRDGRLGVFLNDGRGGFLPSPLELFKRPAVLDHSGILIWPQSTNLPLLLVSYSSYEAPKGNGGMRIFDLANGVMRLGGVSLPGSIGPLAMADLDGDGQLDLFVGGRVMPGRYPEPPSSGLLQGTASGFVQDTNNNSLLVHIGMVSSAIFTDINGDSHPDLVLAMDWGPLQVLINRGGTLRNRDFPLEWETSGNHPATLSAMTGWWNGITAVDLDGDGRMDLVAGNWGRNSPYALAGDGGNFIDYGDWEHTGVIGILEGYKDPASQRELPYISRDALAQAWPGLKDRFSTRRAFGEATVREILGDQAASSHRLTVATLDSVVLLNRGDHFIVRPLPPVAQHTAAMSVVAADFNGDGKEDLFLSQNFFTVGPRHERADTGTGLILLGDGQGGLTPLSPAQSGIRVDGDQRAAAIADYDGDGRTDLVVTQNGEETRLFHNVLGRSGVRLRFEGPKGNPHGVGVQVRLKYGDRLGPAREVHGGSGYWSQDSAVVVLGKSSEPTGVWFRWPGRLPQEIEMPSGTGELRIGESGEIQPSSDH